MLLFFFSFPLDSSRSSLALKNNSMIFLLSFFSSHHPAALVGLFLFLSLSLSRLFSSFLSSIHSSLFSLSFTITTCSSRTRRVLVEQCLSQSSFLLLLCSSTFCVERDEKEKQTRRKSTLFFLLFLALPNLVFHHFRDLSQRYEYFFNFLGDFFNFIFLFLSWYAAYHLRLISSRQMALKRINKELVELERE